MVYKLHKKNIEHHLNNNNNIVVQTKVIPRSQANDLIEQIEQLPPIRMWTCSKTISSMLHNIPDFKLVEKNFIPKNTMEDF